MSTIGNVERKIRRVEHFEVRFLYLNGADVRSDKEGLPQYPFEVAAAADFTVAAWKRGRFLPAFPGYDVKVLAAGGIPVQGNTRMASIRDSYRD
jgi:hypothetical protein